jgi:hypothetical protein
MSVQPCDLSLDQKTRRKLEEQRRMAIRRAIEERCEERRLLAQISDFPELRLAAYLRPGAVAAVAQR